MELRFRDQMEAGRILASRLMAYAGHKDTFL